MKHLLLSFLVIFILAGCGGAGRERRLSSPTPEAGADTGTEGQAVTTQPAPITAGTTILANGLLVAERQPLPLAFKSGGRLLAIPVAVGDKVSSGDSVATLDDEALQQGVTSAELALAQAENSLAQAELALDNLLTWQPDELAVSVAEANVAAAEARYEQAMAVDAAAANNLTSVRIGLDQAERARAEAQEAYDNAWDEARDWEQFYDEPTCLPGQGGSIPCTGVTWKERIERDRDFTTRALQNAQDGLAVAQANYRLAQAGLSDDSALEAEAAVANARQALRQAQTGPKENEIAAARLQVAQAELSVQQAGFNLDQARRALDDANLRAPWDGTILSINAVTGAFVTAGAPIVTLIDNRAIQFHTSNLSERDLAYVGTGQPAQITLKSYPAEVIVGKVVTIVPQATGQSGDAATFTVIIDVGPTDLELLPGMTGRVEIQRAE